MVTGLSKYAGGQRGLCRGVRPRRTLLVGGDGIAIENFLAPPVAHWVCTVSGLAESMVQSQ